MWGLLPQIIRAIAQLLALLGIGWFTFEFAKAGGVTAAAETAKDVIVAVGGAGKVVGEGTKQASETGTQLPILLLVLAALLLTRR